MIVFLLIMTIYEKPRDEILLHERKAESISVRRQGYTLSLLLLEILARAIRQEKK
jgi:hypothetical protein